MLVTKYICKLESPQEAVVFSVVHCPHWSVLIIMDQNVKMTGELLHLDQAQLEHPVPGLQVQRLQRFARQKTVGGGLVVPRPGSPEAGPAPGGDGDVQLGDLQSSGWSVGRPHLSQAQVRHEELVLLLPLLVVEAGLEVWQLQRLAVEEVEAGGEDLNETSLERDDQTVPGVDLVQPPPSHRRPHLTALQTDLQAVREDVGSLSPEDQEVSVTVVAGDGVGLAGW